MSLKSMNVWCKAIDTQPQSLAINFAQMLSNAATNFIFHVNYQKFFVIYSLYNDSGLKNTLVIGRWEVRRRCGVSNPLIKL